MFDLIYLLYILSCLLDIYKDPFMYIGFLNNDERTHQMKLQIVGVACCYLSYSFCDVNFAQYVLC